MEVGGHLVYRGDRDAAEVDPHAGTLGLAQYFFDKALHSWAGGAAGRGGGVFDKAQRVAGQVLNVDGQDLRPVGDQLARQQCSRGHIHNAAHRRQPVHFHATALQFIAADLLQAGIPVLGPRDHGKEDTQVAAGRGLQQRPYLRPQQTVVLQAVLDGRGPGGLIVGVGITGAYGQHGPISCFQMFFQQVQLLLFGQLVQDHRFGAQQAGAHRGQRQGLVLGAVQVRHRQQAERRAIPGQAGLGRHGVGHAAVQTVQRNFAIRLGDMRAVRVHNQAAGAVLQVGVQNGPFAGGQRGHAVTQLQHSGQAHAAGHDGRVADGAVLVAGQPQDHAAVQAEQVAGEEAVRHQNAGALQVQAAARAAVQNIHHAAADIADIHAALPDILIVHVPQAAGKDLLGPLDSGSTARTGGYVIADLIGEGLILQQGDLEQQNVRIGAFGALAQAAQLIFRQHHRYVIQCALPKRVADDAVQSGGAVVDLFHRADHNAG